MSRVNGLLSAQLAPDQIVIALSLELREPQIEESVTEIEREIRAAPTEVLLKVLSLFVTPQTQKTFTDAARRHLAGERLRHGSHP